MGIIDNLKQKTDIPVIIADHRGLIIYVNSKFEIVFDWYLNELEGKSIATIIPDRLHDAHNLGFSRFLSTEKPTLLNKELNLVAITKNGLEFEAIHTIYAEKIDNEWFFGATINPVNGEPHEASR